MHRIFGDDWPHIPLLPQIKKARVIISQLFIFFSQTNFTDRIEINNAENMMYESMSLVTRLIPEAPWLAANWL